MRQAVTGTTTPRSRGPVTAPPSVMVRSCGHDERHEAVRQRGGDEVLVGRHALTRAVRDDRVEVDDVVQVGDVEPRGVRGALAEEVGGALPQPHRGIRGESGQVVEEASGRGAMPLVANRT